MYLYESIPICPSTSTSPIGNTIRIWIIFIAAASIIFNTIEFHSVYLNTYCEKRTNNVEQLDGIFTFFLFITIIMKFIIAVEAIYLASHSGSEPFNTMLDWFNFLYMLIMCTFAIIVYNTVFNIKPIDNTHQTEILQTVINTLVDPKIYIIF